MLVEKQNKKFLVRIENELDLLFLQRFLKNGMEIEVWDRRSLMKKGSKKWVKLRLNIKKVFWKNNKLKIRGRIIKAPEEVSLGYHTFTLEKGKSFWVWEDPSNLLPKRQILGRGLREFFEHLERGDGLSVWGEEVKKLSEFGVIKTLLVDIKKIKEYETVIQRVIEKSGKIVLVEGKDELGKRFLKLTKLGGILRFKL